MMNIFWKVYPTERQSFSSRRKGETCCFAPVVVCSHGFHWADTKGTFLCVPMLGAETQAHGVWLGCSYSAPFLGAFSSLKLRISLQLPGSDWTEGEHRGWRLSELCHCWVQATEGLGSWRCKILKPESFIFPLLPSYSHKTNWKNMFLILL